MSMNSEREFHDYPILKEIFMEQAYGMLYLAIKPNTVVIDIGANIGDTAIYFAMNHNVDKVYAFEFVPSTYELAKSNLERTPFKKKIILKNSAIAGVGSAINVDSKYVGNAGTTLAAAQSNNGKRIRLLSLNEILKRKRNVVIKSDCEGCEAEIFKSADLSNVYAIQLEYHNCKKEVINDLKLKGFKIKDLTPNLGQGILFAKK